MMNKLFWVFSLVVCLLPLLNNINGGGGVMAFHKVYMNYQSLTTTKVKQVHRTGYHFQPKQNWINGTCFSFSIFLCFPYTLLCKNPNYYGDPLKKTHKLSFDIFSFYTLFMQILSNDEHESSSIHKYVYIFA